MPSAVAAEKDKEIEKLKKDLEDQKQFYEDALEKRFN